MHVERTILRNEHGVILGPDYSFKVYVSGETPLTEAWELFQKSVDQKAEFLDVTQTLRLGTLDMMSPGWAYWFARHVIGDRWAAAEEFIATDAEAQSRYAMYLSYLKVMGILGWTINSSETQKLYPPPALAARVAECTQKPKWFQSNTTPVPTRKRKTKRDLNKLADRIGEKVAKIKKDGRRSADAADNQQD